jgi:dipeptidyl aminopeptidase/acylaminoacyl peptidase
MNADGSNVRQWKLPGHPEGLVWAPNGRKIAYSGGARDDENTNGDIWVINADGTGHVRVSGRPGYTNEFPSWSPDSRRIAYASTQAVRADDHSLWIVNADGSRRRRLSPAGRHSSWSPNGHRIVFARAGADGRRRLWLVSPNGKRRHRLSAVVAEFPAWSPDGRRIAYAAVSGGIGFIDTRGRPQKRIATALGQVGWPTWRPAASRLKHASTPTSRREEDWDGADVRAIDNRCEQAQFELASINACKAASNSGSFSFGTLKPRLVGPQEPFGSGRGSKPYRHMGWPRLFSIELELGPETRALVERVVANTTVAIDLEFGPKTLATVKSLFPENTKKREGVEGASSARV